MAESGLTVSRQLDRELPNFQLARHLTVMDVWSVGPQS